MSVQSTQDGVRDFYTLVDQCLLDRDYQTLEMLIADVAESDEDEARRLRKQVLRVKLQDIKNNTPCLKTL